MLKFLITSVIVSLTLSKLIYLLNCWVL